MSKALRIAHGGFGRVALLDMDYSLVRHAHPHCHVLLKVEGADTQFQVDDTMYPLTDLGAVLVNGQGRTLYLLSSEKGGRIGLGVQRPTRCGRDDCRRSIGRRVLEPKQLTFL